MGRNETTSAVIDGILKAAAAGTIISITVMAPNALQALDKPLQRFFKEMDTRSREREYRRILNNMKKQGLIAYRTEGYEHGIKLTKTGKKRLERADFDRLQIVRPAKWDKRWRIVFFDIPENNKRGRDDFVRKLRQLGFSQLQRSVWIYPFSSRSEVEVIAVKYKVNQYVTYLETDHIDASKKLQERFRTIL